MKSLALRSVRFGLATAFALLLASMIATFAGYSGLGHLLYWQGAKMHVWFSCDGGVNLLCVRSPIDWQFFTFGLMLGSLVYTIGWVVVLAGVDLTNHRRMTASRR